MEERTLSLPHPPTSRTVLVGCSEYQAANLIQLPAVANNVRDLALALQDLTGLSDSTIVLNPAGAREVAVPLHEAALDATDFLIFYYAGHGFIGSDGELYLGLTSSEIDGITYTALRYGIVRDQIKNSRARVTIVILDCCFSGRAIEAMSSPQERLAQMAVTGTVVISSAASTALSLAREDEPYTVFTGELIRILRQGIPGAGEVLSVNDIYRAIERRLTQMAYPRPQMRLNANGLIGLARNQARTGSEEGIPPIEPTIDPRPSLSDTTDSSVREQEPGDEFEWFHDVPANRDLLRREPFAAVIASHLIGIQQLQPTASFLLHIDGAWGSGKSSLLNMIDERLAKRFQVVRYDA